jgi:hypothetical protein
LRPCANRSPTSVEADRSAMEAEPAKLAWLSEAFCEGAARRAADWCSMSSRVVRISTRSADCGQRTGSFLLAPPTTLAMDVDSAHSRLPRALPTLVRLSLLSCSACTRLRV